jgi:hypothetical protein
MLAKTVRGDVASPSVCAPSRLTQTACCIVTAVHCMKGVQSALASSPVISVGGGPAQFSAF